MSKKKPTLKETQQVLHERYARHDIDMYSVDAMFRLLGHRISEASRLVRKRAPLNEDLVLIFIRLVSILYRFDIGVSGAMWHKYPNACPRCLEKKNCACIKKEKLELDYDELDKLRRDVSKKPERMRDFQRMFKRIFGHINDELPIEHIWLHFIEECGELSYELQDRNHREAFEETGDVFAWLIAMANKLDIDLEDAIEEFLAKEE